MMIEIKEIPKEKTKFFKKEWENFDRSIGIKWEKREVIFGAFQDRKIVGYASIIITGGVCYLHELLVAKEFRRLGIGKALVERVEKYCKSNGCHKITLETSEKHEDAVEMYKKLGFKTNVILKNYKFNLTWYLMSKDLI